MPSPTFDVATAQRWFAIEANNASWDLVEESTRSREDAERMLSAAHAARWHWSAVGTPLNMLRCESLLAAAYLAADQAELSLHHAQRCLSQLTNCEAATPFDRAGAHAAVACAMGTLDRLSEAREHYLQAKQYANELEADEREVFEKLYPPPR